MALPQQPAALSCSSASADANPAVEVHRYQEFQRHLPWRQQAVVKVSIVDLPQGVDTAAVWHLAGQFGTVVSIDIVQRSSSHRPLASVLFQPAPRIDFWNRGLIECIWRATRISGRAYLSNDSFVIQHEIGPAKTRYGDSIALKAQQLEFGIMYTPNSMKSFHTSRSLAQHSVIVRLNLDSRRLEVEFLEPITKRTNPDGLNTVTELWRYKFSIPFASKLKLFTDGTQGQKDATALFVSVASPPEFSRAYALKDTHTLGELKWSVKKDSWFRIVDLCESATYNSIIPASVDNPHANVKLGCWTTYKISFDQNVLYSSTARDFFKVLENYNFTIEPLPGLQMVEENLTSAFDLMKSIQRNDEPEDWSTVLSLDNTTSAINSKVSLSFKVRYQLEVCMSEGYLSEYNVDLEFLRRLETMDSARACGLLSAVAARKKRVWQPLTIFDNDNSKVEITDIANHCFYARAITVTPTAVYVATPTLDISNRVIRRHRELSDRFLRVRFAEERPKGKLFATTGMTLNRVYGRVKDVLKNGVVVGDRHYHFLAFGNSQLREHTAYFFSSTGGITPASIREWMGDFNDQVVAKYAARLGQCFSTTRAVHGINLNAGVMDDEFSKDNKYIYTDGIGIISDFAASLAANELGALTADGRSPSALQFRLGGNKGVLSTGWPWPMQSNHHIYLRPSQEKFQASQMGLEVIRWSQFASAYLNRQLITILTTLGVDSDVFLQKLDVQISQLDSAMTNPTIASNLLRRDVDANQMTLEVAAMVNNHFHAAEEPFMVSVLGLWRAYSVKLLKEKARILIDKGAHLLGIVDEFAELKGHYYSDQAAVRNSHDINALPEIFVQLSNIDAETGEHKSTIIEGIVLLARNPSLHPGDIRVVRAVDNPNLRHLKDVIVMPKRGDRDLASMCSGGDLDGDDFFVIWDQDLVPKVWNFEPMDFTPQPPVKVDRAVTIDDITAFFVQYVQNDTLPTIAHAHLAWADISSDGAHNEKCLELAGLHSEAVDYPKNGRPASMKPHLRVQKWPHFMEKHGRSYHSTTTLGQIYDRIERIKFHPEYEKPFDQRILSRCEAGESTLRQASLIKAEYDEGIRRIMAQHSIKWELEVWSTFVLDHEGGNKYKFHEDIGHLSSSLKETIRNKCYAAAGGRDYEKIAPFASAMYKVTALEVKEALKKVKKSSSGDTGMPFISFPWIFSSVLGDLAVGRVGVSADEAARSIAAHLTRTTSIMALPTNMKSLQKMEKLIGSKEVSEMSQDSSVRPDVLVRHLSLVDDEETPKSNANV